MDKIRDLWAHRNFSQTVTTTYRWQLIRQAPDRAHFYMTRKHRCSSLGLTSLGIERVFNDSRNTTENVLACRLSPATSFGCVNENWDHNFKNLWLYMNRIIKENAKITRRACCISIYAQSPNRRTHLRRLASFVKLWRRRGGAICFVRVQHIIFRLL